MNQIQRIKSKIRKTVFYPTAILMVLFCLGALIVPDQFNGVLETVIDFLNKEIGWIYLGVSLFLVIVSAVVLFSKMGRVRIGGEDAKPMMPTKSWFSIVLCTTIAAGLIFWGTSEPIFHFVNPPEFLNIEPESVEAGVFSMSTMFLHWTITPYAIYCIPALMFAVAVYNQKKRFSFASCISGIFPKADGERASAIIDAICVFSTVMGLTASLGQGILSIAGGIEKTAGIKSSQALWTVIGVSVVIIFTMSACSGVLRGIKWISNINIVVLLVLMVGIFILGPTTYIIQLSLESFGVYVDNFFTQSLMLGSGSGSDWSYYWTVSTFANWMAWAPITGMFLGKIAYGQTVRRFVIVNLAATSVCSGMWVSVFGGTAIYTQMYKTDLYQHISSFGMESSIYEMLKTLPLGIKIIPILCMAVYLSFVTAADSTTNALGDLCYTGEGGDKVSTIIKIIWGALIGSMAIVLINSKGVDGIKMISTVGGGPAVILLFLSGVALLKVTVNYQKTEDKKHE